MLDINTNVIIVSQDAHFLSMLRLLLPCPQFATTICASVASAKLRINSTHFDIAIFDMTKNCDLDEATNISDEFCVVILVAAQSAVDHISQVATPLGILTMARTEDYYSLYSMVRVATAMANKIRLFMAQSIKLKEKMNDIKLINQAKILLIEDALKAGSTLTEEAAHHRLEKMAMDRRATLITVARSIIDDR